MQVLLNEIGPTGLMIDREVALEWLQEVFRGDFPTPFEPLAATRVTGRLQRLGPDVVVELAGRVRLRTRCASCLEPIAIELPVVFSQTLSPAPARSQQLPEEIELDAADLDAAWFHGDVIELGDLLRQQIILALPMFPRCSPECQGLCPQCGANLNQVDCGCSEGMVDPRWAALRQYKA